MSEQKPETVHNIPVWGVFLLFLGIVFLLQTLNVLPWGLWGTLWRFWPALIIAIGLGILLRRYNTWLVSALIMAMFLACLGIAIWQHEPSPTGQTTKGYSEPLDGLASAQIEIDFTAGNLVVSSLPSSSPNLVEAASQTGNEGAAIRADFRRQDSTGSLRLSMERVNRQFWSETDWDIKFARNIPLTIDVESAVGDLKLNLRELLVTELHMDIDAGNYLITMPSSAGTTYVYIEADIANLEITVPEGVALRLRSDVNLAAFEIDERRFPKDGGYYVSRDFESAEDRIELELDCDIGRVEVK